MNRPLDSTLETPRICPKIGVHFSPLKAKNTGRSTIFLSHDDPEFVLIKTNTREMEAVSMARLGLMVLVLFLAALPVFAEDPEETKVHLVLGGIPLCGDPDVARDYLVSQLADSDKKMFMKQWRSPTDGPSGTTEIKISDPVVPLKIGEHERNPSTLYVFLIDGKIHAVEARWAPRSGWGNFKRMIGELEMKVRASLGEPDTVTSSRSEVGGKSETESVWTEEGRIVRVFSRIGMWKNYVAIDVTCTETLGSVAGEKDVF